MSRKRITLRTMTMPILLLILLSGALPLAVAGAQTVTWLHPTAEGSYKVESAIKDVDLSVRVTNAEGEPVTSAEDLQEAGWQLSKDGFWQNHTRNPKADGRLNVEVSGLPAGRHEVYLQYFQMPRRDGDTWWYFPTIYFGTKRDTMSGAKVQDTRIIRGVGTAEPTRSRNIYDGRIGTAGNEKEAVTAFALGFSKYRWTDTVRYGSIRIESKISMDSVQTLSDTPLNQRMRSKVLAHGPKENGNPVYGVASVSSTLKVRPKRFDSLDGRELSDKVSLFGARGEAVDRQLVVHSPGRDLNDVVLECSDLVDSDGRVIASEAIRFAPVGYVAVNVPHVASEHGWWPEPILTFLERFTIKRGDVQSLWYEVNVPRDAEAGMYRGTVKLKPGNAPPMEMSVVLRVWDFAVPPMPYLRVVGGVTPLEHYDYMMEYGINPTTVYGQGIFPGKDERVVAQLRQWANAGASAISLGYINERPRDPKTGDPTVPDNEKVQEWVDTIGRNYRLATEAGLRDKCYVYMYDEAGGQWAAAMANISDRLRKEFPDLLLLTTAHLFGHPDLSAINGWCPTARNIRSFKTSHEKAEAQDRELWWYTCNSPPRPWANLFLTQPAAAHRQLMGFMAFAAQTDGFLYYAFQGGSARGKIVNGPYTQFPHASRDSHSWMYLNGPGGLNDPLPSIRMVSIRAGLQDYNYLSLACKAFHELRKKGLETLELKKQAEALSLSKYKEPGNPLVKSLREYVREPEKIEKSKRQLGAYIENASRVLSPRQ